MNRVYKNIFFQPSYRKGVTLIEIIMASLLLGFVLLTAFSLYNAGRRFHFSTNDRIIVAYELQYAIDHIYKNVMQGIGDENNSSINIITVNGIPESGFTVRHIDTVDPSTSPSPTYSNYADDKEITYEISSDGKLSYKKVDLSNGSTIEQDNDIIPKVVLLTDIVSGERLSRFYMDGNELRVKFTGEFPLAHAGSKERVTLYSACYPRLASFQ